MDFFDPSLRGQKSHRAGSGTEGACRYVGMDLPGGRPTPGLEEAVHLLASGVDVDAVLREALKVVAREAGGHQALAIARRGDRIVDLASHCVPDACLRSAVADAVAKGVPTRRSNPVDGINAGAVPLIAQGQVVGALGVAGPAERLDPGPLDTAAALILLVLARQGVETISTAPLEALGALTDATSRPAVAEAALAAIRRFTLGPAFLCLEDDGRLQVTRYQGIDHHDLAALVARPEFLELVTRWRERPLPPAAPETVELGGHEVVMVCAPIVERSETQTRIGLVALLVAPEDAPAAARILAALSPHIGARLAYVVVAGELQRRDHEVDGVVQATVAPVVVLDAEGRFLRLNVAASELLGLSGSFDCGRAARGLLGSSELDAVVFDGDAAGDLELELGSPSRHYRTVVTRVHNGTRRLRTIIAFEDLTSRRKHEQAHDDFVSVIGHELRTPLTVAKGFIETVLARGDALDPEQHELFLRKSLSQTERLEDLINDLLFISTERPRESATIESCDVMDLAQQVADRFAAQHPDRPIHCLALGGVTTAPTDRRLVMHAMRHLVDNAIKYSDGPVTVEVTGTDNAVEVAVVDQGPGIFSGELERLFQPFEQLDSSSTRRQGGTGIGLYLSRRLVESLGGRLDCDSRLGQGSRFSFRLPAHAHAPSPGVLEPEDRH